MTPKKDRREGPPRLYAGPPLLTVSEAARYLGIGRKVLYQLIEGGELKAVKLGRSVQVAKDSLDRFRASGKLT